jgi:hypothetical protein
MVIRNKLPLILGAILAAIRQNRRVTEKSTLSTNAKEILPV